jgi:iron complex outermembrane receptor protein
MKTMNLLCGAAAAALVVTPAWAQNTAPATRTGDATSASTSTGVEDIIVTARRTDESLQTTPVAVTALGGESLARQQVMGVSDLQGRAPNLSIGVGGTSAPTQAQLAIRGEAQNSPGTNSDPAVGVYVDGVYIARPIAANVDVLDVNRVEILRGPQGTLFGRNTIGGALSVTTNKPSDKFEGLLRLGVGNYSQRLVEGVLNVPLSNELAVRGVFRFQKHDGYGSYPRLDDRPAGDVKGDYYGRAAIRWSPDAVPLTLIISGDYSHYRDSGQQQTLLGFNSGFELAPGFTIGDALGMVGINPADYVTTKENFRQYFGYANTGKPEFDEPYDIGSAKGLSANLDVDFGDIHMKSITAYRQSLIRDAQDISGIPANLVAFDGRFAQKQFSQETNFSTTLGKLDLIGGLYYFIERGREINHSQSFGFLNPAGPAAQVVTTGTDGNVRNSSTALYAQANYHLTDKLRVTAGFRYTWDGRKVVIHSLADRDDPESCTVIPDVPGGPCNQTRNRSFHYPAWTFGLDYQASENLFIYAKTSGASMAGGWNIRDTISPAFDPENVRDVEAGFKMDLFDRKLRTNTAIFYSWQQKVQRIVNAFDPVFNSITQYVQNAGSARTYGLEVEATLVPWKGMELSGTGAYLHANYTSFFGTQLVDGVPVIVDRTDETVPQSPKYTFSASATQTLDIPIGTVTLHADYAYVASRAFYQDTASPLQPADVQLVYQQANKFGTVPAYGLINGKVALRLNRPDVEIALWGRNLGSKRYLNVVSTFYTSFGPAMGFPGAPRTYGATATFHW